MLVTWKLRKLQKMGKNLVPRDLALHVCMWQLDSNGNSKQKWEEQPAWSPSLLSGHFEVPKVTQRGKGPGSMWFLNNWKLCDFRKWPYLSVCNSQDPTAPDASAHTAMVKNYRKLKDRNTTTQVLKLPECQCFSKGSFAWILSLTIHGKTGNLWSEPTGRPTHRKADQY